MSNNAISHDQPRDARVSAPAVRLLTIDVAGRRGADGAPGVSYHGQQAPAGADGRSGGDAGLAQPGENAGSIHVRLTSERAGRVEVAGQVMLPRTADRPLNESLDIGESGSILLVARGGDGGNGGSGGDGEAGGNGRDGADADQFSSGKNGWPGADGGDGGMSTHGERGGDGGQVIVEVRQPDTHLLMLLEHDCAAGRGGEPGTNGRGGPGGTGGQGGSPYSWTTSTTETYQDAAGNPQSRIHYQSHHHSGGMDGPPGRPGRDGRAAPRAGADGRPGDFRIHVMDDGRVAEFTRRYDLQIIDYELELEDAFAEPTSTVRVKRLTLENTGGMPTPGRCAPEVRLAGSHWLVPLGQPLPLAVPLAPGEKHVFEQELTARVPDVEQLVSGEPLRETDRVSPLAWQTGANRPFANQHPRKTFPVAFACEVESVRSLESQTPGRAGLVRVTIINNSRRALGRASATRRAVAVRLGLRNAEMARHLMLIHLDGRRLTWEEGLDIELDNIESGATAVIEAIVGVLPGAPGYTEAELTATLRLGALSDAEATRERHQRVFGLRIAQPYVFDAQAEILFIANHGTTPAEKAAWEQAAARLGKRINIWDISLNDSLSLSDVLGHGDSLLRDFHGKTIVLANGAFDSVLGTKYADQFISQMDLIKAAESHNIRLLVVNDASHDVAHLFHERLVPTDGQPEFRYSSVTAFHRRQPMDDVTTLLGQVQELVDRGAKAARPDPLAQTSEISLSGIRAPRVGRLRRQAARLQRQLEYGTPGRRYVVKYALPGPEQPDDLPLTEGFFFTHVRQGTLTVMPTVGDSQPNFLVLDSDESQTHAADFILSDQLTAALVQSLSFQDKVDLLDAQLGERVESPPADSRKETQALAERLVDAILVDLAAEQAAVLKTGWQKPGFSKQIAASLERLRFLAEYPFQLTLEEGPQAAVVARLLAGVEFLGRHASRWYEARIFPWSFFRRGPTLRGHTRRLQQQLAAALFGRISPDERKRLNEELAGLERRRRELRRKSRLDSTRSAHAVLFAPLSRNGIRSDLAADFPRLLSENEWHAVRRAEDEREAARVKLAAEKAAARATYLLAMGGRPVPGIDARLQAALQPFIEACASFQTPPIAPPIAETAPLAPAAHKAETTLRRPLMVFDKQNG